MKIDEAEKAFIEALDKSMGNLFRGDWYKRKTVRMAFRKGWEQAIEADVGNRKELLIAFCEHLTEQGELEYADHKKMADTFLAITRLRKMVK